MPVNTIYLKITQCVTDMESDVFKLVEPLKVESVIKVNGELVVKW